MTRSVKKRPLRQSNRRRYLYVPILSLLLLLRSVEAQSPAPVDFGIVPTPGQSSSTFVPSHLPSDMPSLFPSSRPTMPPRPTRQPTRRPTRTPTRRPTRQPTRAPTPLPTRAPTPVPTRRPTRAPTPVPTTPRPTARPTRRPTPPPTVAPTPVPTATPTTPAPTTFTPAPTITRQPTPRPTHSPTMTPSDVPSDPPSPSPSSSPTPLPSSLPSAPPSLPLQRGFGNVNMILRLTEGRLEGRSAIQFESVTAAHIRDSIMRQGIAYSEVDTNIVDQKLLQVVNGQQRRRRRLEEVTARPLSVILDVQVDYRATETYDVSDWIGEAFNSQEERTAYIARLRATGDPAFDQIESVELTVDGVTPIEEEITSPTGTPQNLGAIIGGAVAGAVVVIVLMFFGYRKITADPHKDAPGTASNTGSDQRLAIQTEILVDRQDDVSTLGEPTTYGGMMMNEADRDERTASVAGDYDYTRQFRNESVRSRLTSSDSNPLTRVSSEQSSYSKMGMGPMGASVFSDDASFEQQYDSANAGQEERFAVDVPPGKLGMVIDTPNGGVPMVHALKSESILADRVKVGDRLVSVDKEDVTTMTALQVSKLISLRSDKKRILVFARTSGRLDA